MRPSKTLIAAGLSILLLAACSNNTDNSNHTNTLTAMKDGVSWSAATPTATKDSIGFLIRGVNPNDTMQFHTRGAVVGDSAIRGGYYWKYPSWGTGAEGHCTFTSVSASNVKGTFDVYYNDTATRKTIHFSSGAFDIDY